MATRLDYDPVNVSGLGSINPYAKLNSGFQSAIDNALGVLQTYEDDLGQQASQAILQRAAQYTDPVAYKKALASGEILGDEAKYVSPEFINSLYERGGTLLSNQIRLNKFNQVLDTQAQADKVKRLKTNAASDLAKALTLANNGRVKEASTILRNSETVAALPQNVKAGYFDRVNTLYSRSNNVTQDQRSQAKLAGTNWARQLYTDSGGSVSAIRNAIQSSNLTPLQEASARDFLTSKGVKLITPVENVALNNNQARAVFGEMGRMSSSTNKTFNPESKFWDVAYGAGAYGSADLSAMPIGQAMQWGQGLRDRTEGTLEGQPENVGTSAIGAFQFTKPTIQQFAPIALGSDWKSQQFNAENQWKIAKAIFDYNKEKGIPLDQRWAGLSSEQGEQLLSMSWEEAAPIIASVENPEAYPVRSNQTTTEGDEPSVITYNPKTFTGLISEVTPLIEKTLSRQTSPLPESFEKLRLSNAPAIQVATLITGTEGSLPEEAKPALTSVIASLSEEYELPTAVTGHTLLKYIGPKEPGSFGLIGSATRGLVGFVGGLVNTPDSSIDSLNSYSIDIEGLKNELMRKNSSSSLFKASDRRTTKADMQALQEAQANYKTARTKYETIQQKIDSGAPFSQRNARAAVANMNAAGSRVTSLLSKYSSDNGLDNAGIAVTQPETITANDFADVANLPKARENNQFNLRELSDNLQSARFDLRMVKADPNTSQEQIRNVREKIIQLKAQLLEAQAKVLSQ